MQVRLIGDSKLPVGVNVSMRMVVCLYMTALHELVTCPRCNPSSPSVYIYIYITKQGTTRTATGTFIVHFSTSRNSRGFKTEKVFFHLLLVFFFFHYSIFNELNAKIRTLFFFISEWADSKKDVIKKRCLLSMSSTTFLYGRSPRR